MKQLFGYLISRKLWLFFAVSTLAIEFIALYFQYYLMLEPCIMCIYQRVALWAVVLGAFIGWSAYNVQLMRKLGLFLWMVGAFWGGIIANEHVLIQSGHSGFFSGCSMIPNFPSWAPLHEWIPVLFLPTGDCSAIDWQLFSFSMPQWMVFIFFMSGIVACLILLSECHKITKSNFIRKYF